MFAVKEEGVAVLEKIVQVGGAEVLLRRSLPPRRRFSLYLSLVCLSVCLHVCLCVSVSLPLPPSPPLFLCVCVWGGGGLTLTLTLFLSLEEEEDLFTGGQNAFPFPVVQRCEEDTRGSRRPMGGRKKPQRRLRSRSKGLQVPRLPFPPSFF